MSGRFVDDRLAGVGDVKPPREIEVELSNGVRGTIAIPHSVDHENYYELGYAPPTNKMALILHGQAGHRDYCYQKMLAHKMAAELGLYSLRIDFRGCGSLADCSDLTKGRILDQDVEDIQACAEFVLDGKKNPLGMDFMLLSIIAHSRGSVAMFLWAMQQDRLLRSGESSSKAIIVPNLVNCSLRFRSQTVYLRYNLYDDDFSVVPQMCLRHGKFQNVDVPAAELITLAEADMDQIKDLSMEWSVLSVYGLEDAIIPKEDCSYFANSLNRGLYSHHLELIDGADHNFYGLHPVDNEGDAEEFNPGNLPLTRKKLVNYNYMVSAIIVKFLRPDQEFTRFQSRSGRIGSIARWKNVEGVSNFRDLGGWLIPSPTFYTDPDPRTKYYVRPDFMFRCANTAGLTGPGAKSLQQLGCKTMFDLRSFEECTKDGIPTTLGSVDIDRVHAPVFGHEDYSPQAIALRMSNLMTSWDTYVNVYDHILEHGNGLFRTMFEHIRDHPGRPFVFHCTAGKDRTGVFAMLVLLLAGVDRHTVAKEYELTTYGLKPDHDKIKAKYLAGLNKIRAKGKYEEMEKVIVQGRKDWTLEDDGFENLIGSRYEAMLSTIDLLNTKYGGIVKYMHTTLKFTPLEVLAIYKNLVITDARGYQSREHVRMSQMEETAKF